MWTWHKRKWTGLYLMESALMLCEICSKPALFLQDQYLLINATKCFLSLYLSTQSF